MPSIRAESPKSSSIDLFSPETREILVFSALELLPYRIQMDRMDTATSLTSASVLNRVRHALPNIDHKRIEKAYARATALYGDDRHGFLDQKLIDQVCGVLNVMLEFWSDEDTIIACLLQHVFKKKRMTAAQLEEEFGPAVREIVSCIHLLAHVHFHNRRGSIDDLKKMFISVSNDVRVVVLKLCIRCYTLQNISDVKPAVRAQLCREALDLFAPVAARLGMYRLKHRLEDYAFVVAYPVDHERITEQLDALHKEHGLFMESIVDLLRATLARENIKATVDAREKHPYSIFQKMREKGLTSVRDVHDLYALRVIVPTEGDCYQSLGLIHQLATSVSHRFKDYISFPKPNGYQSLHTCLMRLPNVPHELMIEVQIRTEKMHREAAYGVAAHWSYKEKGSTQKAAHDGKLKNILEQQQRLADAKPTNDASPSKLADHIYVLTPHGDVVELPEGATPLDFAFNVHTDIGLAFRAAKVNGHIVSISHRLENGDVIEIVTGKQAQPSLGWLEELRTSSAKSKLKNYFASKQREDFIVLGRDRLNQELKERKLPVLDPDLTLLKTFDGQELNKHEREDILVKIGMGAVKTATTFRHLEIHTKSRRPSTAARSVRQSRRQHIVEIEDGMKMPLRFAKCCSADLLANPPPIRGFVTRSGEVMVHRSNCRMIKNANPERTVKVKWI